MDLLEDYVFFAQVWQWPPSEVDALRWSWRKEIKQAWQDHVANSEGKK